jgi:hypothetical protein
MCARSCKESTGEAGDDDDRPVARMLVKILVNGVRVESRLVRFRFGRYGSERQKVKLVLWY